MVRGDLQMLINFGDTEVDTQVDATEVLFATPSGIDVTDRVVTLPPHAGAVVRRA